MSNECHPSPRHTRNTPFRAPDAETPAPSIIRLLSLYDLCHHGIVVKRWRGDIPVVSGYVDMMPIIAAAYSTAHVSRNPQALVANLSYPGSWLALPVLLYGQFISGNPSFIGPLHECIAYTMRTLRDNKHHATASMIDSKMLPCCTTERHHASEPCYDVTDVAGWSRCVMEPNNFHVPTTVFVTFDCYTRISFNSAETTKMRTKLETRNGPVAQHG